MKLTRYPAFVWGRKSVCLCVCLHLSLNATSSYQEKNIVGHEVCMFVCLYVNILVCQSNHSVTSSQHQELNMNLTRKQRMMSVCLFVCVYIYIFVC